MRKLLEGGWIVDYCDSGGSYVGVRIRQNFQNIYLKWVHFSAQKLYLNEIDKGKQKKLKSRNFPPSSTDKQMGATEEVGEGRGTNKGELC